MGWNPLKSLGKIIEKGIQVVAEPVKGIVNEVVDTAADIGSTLGQGVRRVAGPFIGVIDDLHNALMPRLRFDLNVNGNVGANVQWPRTTDLNFNIKVPGLPGTTQQNLMQPAVIGDITGGFFTNISADRERLRAVRRRLQMLKHIAFRGHRIGVDDTFCLLVSYVPENPWKFADVTEGANGSLPVFKVAVREAGGMEQVLIVRVSDSAFSRLVEIKNQQVIALGGGLDAAKSEQVLTPVLRGETLNASESLNLLRVQNEDGENAVEINISTLGNPKLHLGAAGTLSVTLIRQSAYLRDSVFFAEFKAVGGQPFGTRNITANIDLRPEFRRSESGHHGFAMSRGATDKIGQILDRAIADASPLKLDALPPDMKWQDRAFELNLKLAEKTEAIAYHLDDIKECLRDLGSEDRFDVRGKSVGSFRPVSAQIQCRDIKISLKAGVQSNLLSVSELSYGEHVTFNVPISSRAATSDCVADWVAHSKNAALVTGDHVAQLELSYGWLDMLETCQSSMRVVDAAQAAPFAAMNTPIVFGAKNHFE